jgi:multicomponent Na+:H+ antiporter subunit D
VTAVALPVAVALPLLALAGALLLRRRPDPREAVSLAVGVAVAAVVLGLWPVVHDGLRFELLAWFPGLTLAFALEPVGLLFATVAAVLWPVTTLYSIGYLRGNGQPRQAGFYAYFALSISAALWIAFSANLVTLFIGYEVLTLATLPLVMHNRDAEARRGGRIYLGVLLTTSIGLLLPAIAWTWLLAGSTEFVPGGLLAGEAGTAVLAVLLALFVFGTGKAALMPFHRWLPAAMVAPTPVSALLHAVAVVKAGVFTVLKVAIYTFGLDTLDGSGASTPMMWVAAGTLLLASLIALTKDNLKARLAYSTVGQLAYIVLAAMLANPVAATGGVLHLATHAVGKITLFFCAGAIYTATHRTRVSELDGLGRAMPWTFGAFLVAAVSIVGLPPMGGTWSKWLLLEGTVHAGQPVLTAVLLVGSLLSFAYLVPIPVRGFFRPAGPEFTGPEFTGHEAPAACVVPLVLTAAACVGLFVVPDLIIEPVGRALELP